jgi:hypothetical protein
MEARSGKPAPVEGLAFGGSGRAFLLRRKIALDDEGELGGELLLQAEGTKSSFSGTQRLKKTLRCVLRAL